MYESVQKYLNAVKLIETGASVVNLSVSMSDGSVIDLKLTREVKRSLRIVSSSVDHQLPPLKLPRPLPTFHGRNRRQGRQ